MELFRGQKNWNVKFSIITLDEKKAHAIEKGVPTPTQRLKAMERIVKAGCGGATLRLRPFIIGVSTPSYVELIKQAGEHGATALSTEFFCVEERSATLKQYMPIFNELCGFDMMSFYKKYSVQSGYLRLNRKVKAPFIRNMKAACDEAGMRFYVSDAHFKEMCANGSCCGLPETWNYSRGQWCEALQIAKKNGIVRYSDVSMEIEKFFSGFKFSGADGFNCNSSVKRAHFFGMSMSEYMRWLWNNPQAGQSPYKLFEGIIVPDGKDENGDLIYRFAN
jgi:hypothetical protein